MQRNPKARTPERLKGKNDIRKRWEMELFLGLGLVEGFSDWRIISGLSIILNL